VENGKTISVFRLVSLPKETSDMIQPDLAKTNKKPLTVLLANNFTVHLQTGILESKARYI